MKQPLYVTETLGRRRIRTGRWNWSPADTRTPLLAFGGIGMNMEILAPLAARLTDRPVIMLDPPGVGGSGEPLLPYTLGMTARWGVELLDRLEIAQADVLGFSWGGAVAQQLAVRHGRRVRRLVVAGMGPGLPMAPGKPAILSHLADPNWLRDLREQPRRAAFFGLDGCDREVLTHDFLERLRLPSPRGYLYQLGALCGWSCALALPLISCPTLVVAGADDQIVPPVNSRLLAALIPRARLEIIAGAGHLLMFSHQQHFERLLREFLGSDKQAGRRAA